MARVLVVSMGGQGTVAMCNLLEGAGHEVRATLGFDAGLEAITESPDLLIVSANLENATGFDLVVAAQERRPGIHCILLDRRYDTVIAAKAKSRQIGYLIEPVPGEEILQQAALRLAEDRPRRWPRKKPVNAVPAEIANRPGRLIDFSYGGLQVELIQLGEVPPQFDVTVPSADVTLRARHVWTRRGPYGWIWCGAELSEASADALARWKSFVDSIAPG